MWLVWLGLQLPSIQVHLNLHKDNNKYSPKSLLWYTSTYFSQRRAHSFSGFANLYSTPLLLGGTGVYRSPQSNYCSWSWNWVYLYRCGLGWNPLLSTPLSKSFFYQSDPFKLALTGLTVQPSDRLKPLFFLFSSVSWNAGYFFVWIIPPWEF